MSLDRELQSYAVSEGEGKYETAVLHGYIGYRINVALAHKGLKGSFLQGGCVMCRIASSCVNSCTLCSHTEWQIVNVVKHRV